MVVLRRALLPLLFGLVASSSCADPSAPALVESTAHLADRARGGIAAQAIPTVELAGVRRPVLDTSGTDAPTVRPQRAASAQAATSIQTAGPLDVPPAARLRFAIGVDEQEWPAGLAPVTFRVAATGAGDDAVLFERTLEPSDPRQRRWLDADVDLAPFAGKTVTLRFEATPAPGHDGPFGRPVWADPTLVVRSQRTTRRPNLLLISMDTLRADHIGAYGYRRPTTPTIDARLAARGVVFDRAYTSYPSTPGAHMTLFTALPTCVHGVDGVSVEHRLPLELTTLPELLRAAGYATAAFVEDAWVTHTLGFARGFGTWVENTSPEVNAPLGQAEKTFAEAAAWIDTHRDQPWLVFAHTYQVHHPYAPPAGYRDRVAGPEPRSGVDEDVALYDGEIRYTDDLLAKLLDAIEASGQLRDTIVVLFSDHGEHFGEHGQHKHGFSLYDQLLRVALIVSGPGVPQGLRVSSDVGLIDVLPTMLELAGLPAVPDRQGRSMMPLLRGEAVAPRTLYAELPVMGLVAARRDGRKVLIDTKKQQAWTVDLATDPEEMHGRPSFDDPETVARLAEFERSCAARPARSPGSGAPAQPVDPAVQEKLRALGYAS